MTRSGEVKPFPSRGSSFLTTLLVAIASGFMFVSMLWQHIASAAAVSMVSTLTYGSVEGHVGAAATTLGWVAVLLQLVSCAGLIIMILSISALSEILG